MVINYSISATLPKFIFYGKQCDCAVVGAFGAVDLYDATALWALGSNVELAVRCCIEQPLSIYWTTIGNELFCHVGHLLMAIFYSISLIA